MLNQNEDDENSEVTKRNVAGKWMTMMTMITMMEEDDNKDGQNEREMDERERSPKMIAVAEQ